MKQNKVYANSAHIFIETDDCRKIQDFKREQNVFEFDAQLALKFIYSEKATKFCKISTLYLTVCIVVKSKVEISQNFVAFSEYMNFNFLLIFKQTVFYFSAKTIL